MSEVWDGCSSLSAWIEGHRSKVPLENILLMAAPSIQMRIIMKIIIIRIIMKIITNIIVPRLAGGKVESSFG